MIKRDLTLTWASPCKTGTWWSWRLDSRGQSVKKEIFITRPSLNTHLHKGSTKCTVSYFEKLNRPCGQETILVSKRALRTRGPINSKFGNRTKVSPRQCFLFLFRKRIYTELFVIKWTGLDWIGLEWLSGTGVSTDLRNVRKPKVLLTKPLPAGQDGYSIEQVPSKVTSAEKA